MADNPSTSSPTTLKPRLFLSYEHLYLISIPLNQSKARRRARNIHLSHLVSSPKVNKKYYGTAGGHTSCVKYPSGNLKYLGRGYSTKKEEGEKGLVVLGDYAYKEMSVVVLRRGVYASMQYRFCYPLIEVKVAIEIVVDGKEHLVVGRDAGIVGGFFAYIDVAGYLHYADLGPVLQFCHNYPSGDGYYRLMADEEFEWPDTDYYKFVFDESEREKVKPKCLVVHE